MCMCGMHCAHFAGTTNFAVGTQMSPAAQFHPVHYIYPIQEVLALLPEPDLTQYQERLSQLLHNIFRALPRTRLASTRGALSYRQVKVHLLEFKVRYIFFFLSIKSLQYSAKDSNMPPAIGLARWSSGKTSALAMQRLWVQIPPE